jgi:hypothetical protein
MRSTICPHNPLMATADLARKDLAIALMGEKLYFKHLPKTDETLTRIVTITWNGMVYVEGYSGMFDPTLFKVAS